MRIFYFIQSMVLMAFIGYAVGSINSFESGYDSAKKYAPECHCVSALEENPKCSK